MKFENKWLHFIKFSLSLKHATQLYLDWSIFEEQKECDGPGIFMGDAIAPSLCADACRDKSSMFIHGRKENGEYGCFCESQAKSNGICFVTSHSSYNLYQFGRLI